MAVGSPSLLELDLERHGLEWCWPEVDLAHPLDDGSAGVMLRSIEDDRGGARRRRRAPGGGVRRAVGRASTRWARTSCGRSCTCRATRCGWLRFGLPAATPATVLARRFRAPQARALFGGVAAHAFSPLTTPMSSSVGMALICACHRFGWPVARGGSRAITDALAAVVARARRHDRDRAAGHVAGRAARRPTPWCSTWRPAAVADIAGDRLPARVARAYRRYRHGPGAFKVDLAVEGGVPWTAEPARRAGTVHAIGSFEEIVGRRARRQPRADAGAPVRAGRPAVPGRPDSRSAGDVHPVWAYAHVPSGYDGDATEAMIDQIERFAPGLRERIVGPVRPLARPSSRPTTPTTSAATSSPAPTRRGRSCSGRGSRSTPTRPGSPASTSAPPPRRPGAGAHGMNGYNAARSALRHLGV